MDRSGKARQNAEAYQLYVKARYAWNKRTAADLQPALSEKLGNVLKDIYVP
jgi:hypothetical protein